MNIKTLFSIGIIFLFSSMFASAALDLQFTTAISQSPDPASAGGSVTFTVAFKTFGGAVTNMKITGGVDGTQLFERTYASILADKGRTDSFTWTATAGSHTVWFELDPGHTCGDSNYGNNRIEKSITVVSSIPVGQPDLSLRVSYSPRYFATGNPVTFLLRVDNKGTAPSAACNAAITLYDNVLLHLYNVPAIAVGGHWEDTYSWPAGCSAIIAVWVDIGFVKIVNNDSNPANNFWHRKMECNAGRQIQIKP